MSENKRILRRLPRRVMCFLITAALVIFTVIPAFAQEPKQVDITASVTGTNADMINSILEDSKITIKTDSSDDSFLFNLDAVVSGQSALRALLEIADGKIAFSVPNVENVRYEYDLQNLLMMLEEAYGSPYGAQPGTQEDLSQALAGAMVDMSPGEVMEALLPYLEYLEQALASVMRTEDGVIELEQLGKSVEGTLITYEPGAEDFARVFGDLADMIEKDEALKGVVDKICTSVMNPEGLGELLLKSSFTSGTGVDLAQAAADLREDYEQFPALLREAAQDISEQGMGDAYVRFTVGAAGGFHCKYQLQAGSPSAGQAYEACAEIDPDGSGLSFYIGTQDRDFSLTFNSADSGDYSTTAVVTAKVNKVPVFILTFTLDPENGFSEDFPLASASLDILGICGSLTIQNEEGSGKAWVLNVTGLEVPGDSLGISGVTVKAQPGTASDLERPAGEVVDLTGYSPEELLSALQYLGEKIAGNMSGIGATVTEEEAANEPATEAEGGNASIEFVLGYGTDDAETILTQDDLDYARTVTQSDVTGNNQYCIEVGFNEAGTQAFADVTRDHIGETLSILINGEEISAPRINEEIADGKCVISGNFTFDEAQGIADSLMK